MATTIELKTFFINIRTIREFRNYSQDYMAMKLGVTQNAYSKIELGYTNISLVHSLAIADALQVTIADLIELDTERFARRSVL